MRGHEGLSVDEFELNSDILNVYKRSVSVRQSVRQITSLIYCVCVCVWGCGSVRERE